jgi:hypothetical protein
MAQVIAHIKKYRVGRLKIFADTEFTIANTTRNVMFNRAGTIGKGVFGKMMDYLEKLVNWLGGVTDKNLPPVTTSDETK